ncbi:MAG TPA: Wzz/FepE/Etk N-terminal domain-containing protein [Mobilitalea sp.]|nr:Wzz/FepE/Etk N-terminal domain-containing protein [Mobilitalea sp.]
MDTGINNIIEINLKDLFRTLLRRSWLILLVGIMAAGAAQYYSMNYITPIYTSSAKLYLISKMDGQSTTLSDLQIGSILAQDYKYLVKSRSVAKEVIKRLNLNMSSGQLSSMITVYSPDNTRILVITVTYYDQEKVKELVDTIAKVSSEQMVSIMGMDEVNLMEEGYVPGGPSSPDVKRNTMIAGFSGILATTVLVTMLFLFNDSIKTAEDIEKHLGLTTLGFIPVETVVKKKKSKSKQKKIEAA